jgi:transposase-like protein
MGLVRKILGRSNDVKGHVPSCPHTILLPRWDSIEDMGKTDKAVGFTCQSCGRTFSREEAAALKT